MVTKKYGILASVVDEMLAGRDDVARRLLSALVDSFDQAGATPEDVQYYIFASALSRRLAWERSGEINLYLQQFQRSQISLFNLVAQHLPTVGLAGRAANDVLAQLLGGRGEITLLDLGIGTGRQETALLRQLAIEGRLPERLNVIAVEPDAGSLAIAEADIQAMAEEIGLPLRFLPVPKLVEDLAPEDWGAFAWTGAPLVVNAAFALHHVRNTETAPARDQLFHWLRGIDAEAVVLSEPSSDHLTDDFRQRFLNCWHHFGQTFRLIDSLELPAADAGAMKTFFAREIEDILGNPDERRYERHQPAEAWVSQLRDAGFTPAPDLSFAAGGDFDGVRMVAREGYVGLDYQEETLVAILCATAVPTGADLAPVEARAMA
ncbi:MAG TPA: GRAS family protein [Longimicrobiaceae bacterium]|jgi:hypothetical protein|nr:GRAS family protein [Longimicrobiaceae bacterium]